MRRHPWIALGALALAIGCGNDQRPEECTSDADYFERQVWNGVMGKVCIRCHTPAGAAAEVGAKFRIQPAAYPGFLDFNRASAGEMARVEVEGISTLLRKPLGELNHGGGAVIEKGSREYEILSEFVARSASPTQCVDQPLDELTTVQMLDAQHTFRKAALDIAGRLPKQSELDQLAQSGDDALPGLLDSLMHEEPFYAWVKEMWNDQLLVDRFLSYTGRALDTLNATDWPLSEAYYDALPQLDKEHTNNAIAREALELIVHVVRNDRPFTEILTADYTVMNPFSARIYNVDLTGKYYNATDPNEWREQSIVVQRASGPARFPHAGILSNTMWLNRFPTTPTNRSRHRARMIYQHFLATDVLAIADRPIDAAQATQYLNPPREDPSCKVCHAMIDPVAGGFMKWNANDQEQWQPQTTWFPEMYPPGFEGEVIPASTFNTSLPWVAGRIASDPRFPVAITRNVFTALTSQKPLEYPAADDPAFETKRTAFRLQDQVLSTVASQFVDSGYDFREVVKGIVLSPYYRADTAILEDDELHAAIGTAKLLTPERLARKIEAVTGAPWVRGYDRRDLLLTDYRIAYGGIDSDLIVDRLTSPNTVMSNIAWRLANEVACNSVAWDFTRPAANRTLFPKIELTDLTEGMMGVPTPDAAAKIRASVVHLHERVLGETLEPTHPEIERTYQLFLESWKDGADAVRMTQVSNSLHYNCRGRWDRNTGYELPQPWIEQDRSYAIRAWMAVMTYLVADYRFLYH